MTIKYALSNTTDPDEFNKIIKKKFENESQITHSEVINGLEMNILIIELSDTFENIETDYLVMLGSILGISEIHSSY